MATVQNWECLDVKPELMGEGAKHSFRSTFCLHEAALRNAAGQPLVPGVCYMAIVAEGRVCHEGAEPASSINQGGVKHAA